MSDFIKKPCKHCPFRHDVKPFLHPERAEDLAYSATNPYSSFPCHKTTEHDDNDDGFGKTIEVETTKQCAGFLTLMHNELGETPYDEDGFKPSVENVYSEVDEMINAYEDACPR